MQVYCVSLIQVHARFLVHVSYVCVRVLVNEIWYNRLAVYITCHFATATVRQRPIRTEPIQKAGTGIFVVTESYIFVRTSHPDTPKHHFPYTKA